MIATRRVLLSVVRRELWENRWLLLVPAIAAAAVLATVVIGTIGFVVTSSHTAAVNATAIEDALVSPLHIVGTMILLTGFLVSFIYCADALHGERRDPSLAFWKALPVSDAMAVLSKALVPLLVVPALTLGVLLVAYLGLGVFGLAALGFTPAESRTVWASIGSVIRSSELITALVVGLLWNVPLFAWVLLVSGAVRRAPIAWAILPPIMIGVVEQVATGYARVVDALMDRGVGFYWQPFGWSIRAHPADFLARPGLWIGLVAAAGMILGAIELRRRQGPI